MTYLLLSRRSMTAKELAERFEVSERTVYRDVDALSAAGIPVYAAQGKGGGIRLLENFVLDRSVLSEAEQREILSALRGLAAVHMPDMDRTILEKLGGIFRKETVNWVDIDFSGWEGRQEREWFPLLKEAVLQNRVIQFDYFGSTGEQSKRAAEPLRLVFKGRGWYLYAYCRTRGAERLFKLTRMKNLLVTQERFERTAPDKLPFSESYPHKMFRLKLRLDASCAFRVYDEFPPEQITRCPDGSFLATAEFPPGDWIFGYLLTFGDAVSVLEPEEIRSELVLRLRKALKNYL